MEDEFYVCDVDAKCPDDKILNYCLQLKYQSIKIILVINDKNLSNRALVNSIETINSKECLEKFR